MPMTTINGRDYRIPDFLTADAQAVLRHMVLRQTGIPWCKGQICTALRDLGWDLPRGRVRDALKTLQKRGFAEYIDPVGWRAVLVQPEPEPPHQLPIIRLVRSREVRFAFENPNDSLAQP